MNGQFLLNYVNREIQAAFTLHTKEMVGYIDSYNKKDHTAKVKFPTELDSDGKPRISGWMPVGVGAGSMKGISWVIGPQVGDQCTVGYLEGDSEAPYIKGFLHNVTDTPPSADSGQAVLQHNTTGNYLTVNTDGTIQIFHKKTGNYSKMDTSGNFVTYLASPAQQHYLGGDPAKGGTFLPVMLADMTPSPYAKARKS